MPQLTAEGQSVVAELAQRYGFSHDAVTHMMCSVLAGRGTMAQFSHPEFGGSGQWMRGGMTMLGDMFNNSLKGRVDSLCSELSTILNNQPDIMPTGGFQSQHQSSGQNSSDANAPLGPSTLFVPDPRAQWYPKELGTPNSTGSQNNVRYAYFANAHRLAVDSGGDVWVYDTLNHQIGGFSQQQGSSGSITFTSQFGTVNLASLPVVFRNGQSVTPASDSAPPRPTASPSQPVTSPSQPATSPSSADAASSKGSTDAAFADIFSAIERLGDLKARGILSDEEFSAKKAELLARL